jgi:hypothetical protein
MAISTFRCHIMKTSRPCSVARRNKPRRGRRVAVDNNARDCRDTYEVHGEHKRQQSCRTEGGCRIHTFFATVEVS